MTWKPRQVDIMWAHNMVSTMNEGGVWGVPMSQQIYRFNHSQKQIELITGPSNAEADDLFEKNKIVFGMCGYSVVDSRREV